MKVICTKVPPSPTGEVLDSSPWVRVDAEYVVVSVITEPARQVLLQIVAAATFTGLLGLGIGLLSLRLRGIFFSIATVAVAIIFETIVINWDYMGGAKGLQLLRPAPTPPFGSYTTMLFFVMLVMAIAAVAIARYIENSWIGRGLRAIRDNEEAAECVGVPTLKLKLIATVVSGALMGAAGAPFPMYMSFIEPVSAFSLNYSVSALAMPIIGGTARPSRVAARPSRLPPPPVTRTSGMMSIPPSPMAPATATRAVDTSPIASRWAS